MELVKQQAIEKERESENKVEAGKSIGWNSININTIRNFRFGCRV